jgi:hypothetical protein
LGALIGGVCTLVGAYIAVTYTPNQTVQVHCESTAQLKKEVSSTISAEKPATRPVSPPEKPVRQSLTIERHAEKQGAQSTKP